MRAAGGESLRYGVEFEEQARRVDLLDVGPGEAPDHRGAARGRLDQAVTLEPGERLLDRRLADRQRFGDFLGKQALAGRKHTGDDPAAKLLIGLLGKGRADESNHAARP